jgi:acetyl esterase/lipase
MWVARAGRRPALTEARHNQIKTHRSHFCSSLSVKERVGDMKNIWLVALLFLAAVPVAAQDAARKSDSQPVMEDASAEPKTMPLWEGKAPGALGDADSDRPTITLYAVAMEHKPTAAVIVFPGGGYGYLATNHEGRQIANWLNSAGITAFVVRYRLGPRYHHPTELRDAQRAIRLVRARAKEFGVLPDKIGVLGFSAGGHLASTAETHFDVGNPGAADAIDRVSSRPDFAVLAYPVISFTTEYTHGGSSKNLLGENPKLELLKELSSELNVTARTPPTFLFSTSTDTGVPPENSVAFYLALHKAGVPAELHVFESAPHGVGLDLSDPAVGEWSHLLLHWFRERSVVVAPTKD